MLGVVLVCDDESAALVTKSGAFVHGSWEVCPADPRAQVQGGVLLAVPLALCSLLHIAHTVLSGDCSLSPFPGYPTTFQDAALPRLSLQQPAHCKLQS